MYPNNTNKNHIKIQEMGWEYNGTGGGCDAFFYDLKGEYNKNKYLMLTNLDSQIPTRKTDKVAVGVYDDDHPEGFLYIDCKFEDILSKRITFFD